MTATKAPSKRALAKASALGRQAARDSWMAPCPEEYPSRNLGDISQAHRDGWEETLHFAHYYGRTLDGIADSEAERLYGGVGNVSAETRHYTLYDPLRDAFWDAYEESTGFYALAKPYAESQP